MALGVEPSTPTVGGKKHCLLVTDDNTDFAWSYFEKEKFELKTVMLHLIIDLKANGY